MRKACNGRQESHSVDREGEVPLREWTNGNFDSLVYVLPLHYHQTIPYWEEAGNSFHKRISL